MISKKRRERLLSPGKLVEEEGRLTLAPQQFNSSLKLFFLELHSCTLLV